MQRAGYNVWHIIKSERAQEIIIIIITITININIHERKVIFMPKEIWIVIFIAAQFLKSDRLKTTWVSPSREWLNQLRYIITSPLGVSVRQLRRMRQSYMAWYERTSKIQCSAKKSKKQKDTKSMKTHVKQKMQNSLSVTYICKYPGGGGNIQNSCHQPYVAIYI